MKEFILGAIFILLILYIYARSSVSKKGQECVSACLDEDSIRQKQMELRDEIMEQQLKKYKAGCRRKAKPITSVPMLAPVVSSENIIETAQGPKQIITPVSKSNATVIVPTLSSDMINSCVSDSSLMLRSIGHQIPHKGPDTKIIKTLSHIDNIARYEDLQSNHSPSTTEYEVENILRQNTGQLI